MSLKDLGGATSYGMKKILLFVGILIIGLAAILFIGRGLINNLGMPSPTISPSVTSGAGLDDLIRLEKPEPNQLVSSPLVVTGEASGNWYFEASFPVRIYDAYGVELGVIPAQAQGEWMTEEFVPFRAVLEFSKPTTEVGTLVLQKDNPSGLPEHDAELRVPVRFDLTSWVQEPSIGGECRVTGCSGQICADEDVITTCEYKNEYACFKTAKCERQEDGKCGWTPTEELVACLSEAFQAESE